MGPAAWAQSEPAPVDAQAAPDQFAPAQPPASAPQPGLSADDPRLVLMVRNAIIALNQANLTGNYSVLRDLGTPNFQQTNSQARLAEAFTTLRARKLDISPVMFFTPKFVSAPAMQDGQVLRATGFFPTTPEQVNFDLAIQLSGEQWALAAIAVNVTPPGENVQAILAPAPHPARALETSEQKPVQIDLTQPSAPPPAQAAVVSKKAAPRRRPPAQKTAAAQPAASSASSPEQPAQAPQRNEEPVWNPFGR